MGTDKNTTIGFILLAGLLIALFTINSKNRLEYEGAQKKRSDSLALVQKKQQNEIKKKELSQLPLVSDTLIQQKEEFQVVENEVARITFSSKGARPVQVLLKKYNKHSGKPVMLMDSANGSVSYRYKSGTQSKDISETYFIAQPLKKKSDGTSVLTYQAKVGMSSLIQHQYIIPANDYRINLDMQYSGTSSLFDQDKINLIWDMDIPAIEKDFRYEATQTHFCFSEGDKSDFEYMSKDDALSFSNKINWMGVKRQFFINALECKNDFSNVTASWTSFTPQDSLHLSKYRSNGQVILEGSGETKHAMINWYMGPSDYNILNSYNNQMETMVPYGSGIFAFVKHINRYFLLPVFDYLQKHIASMGLVILLLTLIIRLFTSPILYKSYLSGAKMKALKPEVDALRDKFKDDQQAFGMEQMKLWKSAGVSPLGGCIPALLQIPIFMSLYYFFQANIDLRGKAFLWSSDLASYDSIAQFSFDIPFYGNHVSLFTLTAVITSLLISLYGMSNMQDNSNPLMKYMPYIFPVLLLGVFNNLPSALTWYYTISNTITLLMQVVIQKYIINPEKILEQIAENRKKPVKKSKWQERIEAMQESQRKLQEMKKK